MPIPRMLLAALAATITASADVHAQIRADPGVLIGSKIGFRVYVTLQDEDTLYYPIASLVGCSSARGSTASACLPPSSRRP